MKQQVVSEARRNVAEESHSKNSKPVKMILITMSKSHSSHASVRALRTIWIFWLHENIFLYQAHFVNQIQGIWLGTETWPTELTFYMCLTLISSNWPSKQSVLGKKKNDEVLWHVVCLALWIRHNTPFVSIICQNWEPTLSLGFYGNCFSLFKLTFWADS